MKPEELLDPETLPDDLRWLAAEFKLQPKDPVFLLIAWHWHRVQEAEDSLRMANVALQGTLDSRVDAIADTAEAVAGLGELLLQVQSAIEERPALIAAQLEAELKGPLAKLGALEKTLDALVRCAQADNEKAQRMRILAALLVGVALGVLSAVITLLA